MKPHLFTMCRQLYTEATGRCRLSDSSFTANKDPLKRLLIENVLQARIGEIVFQIVVRHGAVYLSSCLFVPMNGAKILETVVGAHSAHDYAIIVSLTGVCKSVRTPPAVVRVRRYPSLLY